MSLSDPRHVEMQQIMGTLLSKSKDHLTESMIKGYHMDANTIESTKGTPALSTIKQFYHNWINDVWGKHDGKIDHNEAERIWNTTLTQVRNGQVR